MRLLIHRNAASQNRTYYKQANIPTTPKWKSPLFWFVLFFLILLVRFSIKPFLERGDDGILRIAKWRKEKLDREINELDDAEQYALLAMENGEYPCHSCIGKNTITLKSGEVWKYGYTAKSEKGRYRNSLGDKNLFYMVQYRGSIADCMKEEKRKIYFYAVLPENLSRIIPLIRPPGNKQDN